MKICWCGRADRNNLQLHNRVYGKQEGEKRRLVITHYSTQQRGTRADDSDSRYQFQIVISAWVDILEREHTLNVL